MDLSLNEDHAAIVELARRIFEDHLPPERLRTIETGSSWFARDVWQKLAEAGMIGVGLPEREGGGGFGALGASLVLEEVGRAVAPVPYHSTVMLGALPLARFGDAAQKRRDLPAVLAGKAVLGAALCEAGDPFVPESFATTARREGSGYRLDGEKWFVSYAEDAQRLLVAASGPEGPLVLLVDPSVAGISLERAETSSFEPQWIVRFDGVEVGASDVLGGPDVVAFLVDHALAGLCAMQAGVSEKALRLTAAHVSEREQFGQKIATFQAVAQRAADAFIDNQAIALTSRQAAWRLTDGRDAAAALAIAKYWAAEAGQRVAHAAQHLHGGIGVDTDYPLHRYFRWAKVLELSMGGAAVQLDRLGRLLAGGGAAVDD